MATLSEDEQALIQRDREENPGCFYSTALSQSCRSMNGESKCEIAKKIFRQCPGKNKELISNRKEITEDEHAGDDVMDRDFFSHERMDSRKGQHFGAFDPFRPRDDDFEAQLSPFDFFRQEMLRPFEGLFGGSRGGDDGAATGGLFGGSGAHDLFAEFERQFERMPVQPPSSTSPPRRPAGQPSPPPNPPHYSYQPAQGQRGSTGGKARAQEQKDLFEGYTGRVEEI